MEMMDGQVERYVHPSKNRRDQLSLISDHIGIASEGGTKRWWWCWWRTMHIAFTCLRSCVNKKE
jgi:hypothetical protein